MRSALLNQPEFTPQAVTGSGRWSSGSVSIPAHTKKVVEKATAVVVRNVPHRKSRELIASVISYEVERGLKGHAPVRSLSLNESRWVAFFASRLAGKDAAEALMEGTATTMVRGPTMGLSSALVATPLAMDWLVLDGSHPELASPAILSSTRAKMPVAVAPDVYPAVEDNQISEDHVAFRPSDVLIRHWIAGMNENIREAGGSEIQETEVLNHPDFYMELSRQIHKLINNFAKRKAYEPGRYRITFGGNLYPSLEGLIADHLMLPPRSAVPFLNELKRQLYEQSANEPVFRGRWGELIVDDANELVLSLVKRKRRKLLGVLRG